MNPNQKPPATNDTAPKDTTPAEEWGERLDTGRAIARGGKEQGDVPGATENPEPSQDRDDRKED